MSRDVMMLLACLFAGSALLAQDAAGPAAVVRSTYDRLGTGFRDSFERLKSRGDDTYVAEFAAAHPSHLPELLKALARDIPA